MLLKSVHATTMPLLFSSENTVLHLVVHNVHVIVLEHMTVSGITYQVLNS